MIDTDGDYWIGKKDNLCSVRKETVAPYTGKTDLNGNKIFEGDIVKHRLYGYDDVRFGEISYNENCCAFFVIHSKYKSDMPMYEFHCFEVIGNIHDNPDLLGGERNGRK